MRCRRWAFAFLLAIVVAPGVPAFHVQAQPQMPDEFVPLSELPPEEALPAAPLLISAYAFVWVVVLLYLWSIWRRLQKVERDLASLAARTGGTRNDD